MVQPSRVPLIYSGVTKQRLEGQVVWYLFSGMRIFQRGIHGEMTKLAAHLYRSIVLEPKRDCAFVSEQKTMLK